MGRHLGPCGGLVALLLGQPVRVPVVSACKASVARGRNPPRAPRSRDASRLEAPQSCVAHGWRCDGAEAFLFVAGAHRLRMHDVSSSPPSPLPRSLASTPLTSSKRSTPQGRLVTQVPNEDPERVKRVLDAKYRVRRPRERRPRGRKGAAETPGCRKRRQSRGCTRTRPR
eukprot:366097-Chlamydomonas_euryale.AAC.39